MHRVTEDGFQVDFNCNKISRSLNSNPFWQIPAEKLDNRQSSVQITVLHPEVYEECPSRGIAVYFSFMLRIVADILSEHNCCVLEGNIKYVFIIQLHCMLIHSEHPQLHIDAVVWR